MRGSGSFSAPENPSLAPGQPDTHEEDVTYLYTTRSPGRPLYAGAARPRLSPIHPGRRDRRVRCPAAGGEHRCQGHHDRRVQRRERIVHARRRARRHPPLFLRRLRGAAGACLRGRADGAAHRASGGRCRPAQRGGCHRLWHRTRAKGARICRAEVDERRSGAGAGDQPRQRPRRQSRRRARLLQQRRPGILGPDRDPRRVVAGYRQEPAAVRRGRRPDQQRGRGDWWELHQSGGFAD